MKKKKIFIVILIIIVLFRVITQSDYFYYNSDKITVYKYYDSIGLTLNIKNHFIEKRATLKFASSKDLEDMAKIITEQNYKIIYGKTDEYIYIFADGVYYLYIDEDRSNIFRNRYIYSIKRATIAAYDDKNMTQAYIPFPCHERVYLSEAGHNKEEIKCGFKYLKEFYKNVETATVYDDMIDVDAIIYNRDIYGENMIRTDKYVRIKYEGDNVISFEVLDKEK